MTEVSNLMQTSDFKTQNIGREHKEVVEGDNPSSLYIQPPFER